MQPPTQHRHTASGGAPLACCAQEANLGRGTAAKPSACCLGGAVGQGPSAWHPVSVAPSAAALPSRGTSSGDAMSSTQALRCPAPQPYNSPLPPLSLLPRVLLRLCRGAGRRSYGCVRPAGHAGAAVRRRAAGRAAPHGVRPAAGLMPPRRRWYVHAAALGRRAAPSGGTPRGSRGAASLPDRSDGAGRACGAGGEVGCGEIADSGGGGVRGRRAPAAVLAPPGGMSVCTLGRVFSSAWSEALHSFLFAPQWTVPK